MDFLLKDLNLDSMMLDRIGNGARRFLASGF